MVTLQVVFSDKHNDFFDLDDGEGNVYKWHGRKGVLLNPKVTLERLRAKMDTEGTTEWKSTHPKEASVEYQADVAEYESSPIHGLTYAQADAYIDNNVTDLNSIKIVLTKMARRIISLERQVL